mmetsp:Transcript_17400/g.40404  ORF Transcript_17400/g.40404 Transcript_17400/m.40404 type:complete len:331 (+) Transcript_17400:278-1270(+)
MHTATKSHVGIRNLVLFPAFCVAIGVKQIGLGKDSGNTHSHTGRHSHHITLGNSQRLAIGLYGNILHCLANQENQRRAQSERFLHAVVQQFHLAEFVEVHITTVFSKDLVLFGHDAFPNFGIVGDKETCPGGCNAGCVLSGKQESNEQSRDFLFGALSSVLVFHVHEDGEDIRSICFTLVGTALGNHLGEKLYHALSGQVALSVGLGGCIGPKDSEGSEALVQIVVELRYLHKHLLAYVVAMQTAGCRENRELRQIIQQVGFTTLAPLFQVKSRLSFDLGDVALQPAHPQAICHTLKLGLTILASRIVHHVGTKNGSHEIINLILRKHVV